MLDILKLKFNQGNQTIPDIKKAVIHKKFRGLPSIGKDCGDCGKCKEACPSDALLFNPLRIDLGKCVLCGDCGNECPKGCIGFSNYHKLASTSREHLVIDGSMTPDNYSINAIEIRNDIRKLFGRSLKLRQVSAGGCNGCEMELNACSNVNFDIGRFGIEIAASPRHSDGIVITGPVTENMASALEDSYRGVPAPKIVIAVGSCAISGGVFQNSKAVNRDFFKETASSLVNGNYVKKRIVDLYIPGCPPHPLTFINGVLDFLGR